MPGLRIALAQVNPCVGDIAGNAALVREWSRRAADAGADLVAFPEMVMVGYPIEDLALRESFQRAAARAVEQVAADLAADGLGALTVVLGSLGTNAAGRPTNDAYVIHGGAVTARYAKHHLPNYGVFDERRIFAHGSERCVVEVAGTRVGIVICEDIWQDGGPVAAMADADVQLLLVINGSPFEEGKGRIRTALARRRAAEVRAPLAYVNMWGGQDDLVFDGHSFIVAADGAWMANAGGFRDELLVWDVPSDDDTPVQGSVPPTTSRSIRRSSRGCVTMR
jgi:NAD+ synthase (glutamine-hydrolysing)